MADERSRTEAAGAGPDDATKDVARIEGLYFCIVPDGHSMGTVVPFLHVTWMRYFNPLRHMQVGDREQQALRRCQSMHAG